MQAEVAVDTQSITDKKVLLHSTNNRLLAVPVKYGKTYTIALDSTVPVILQPIIYNDHTGLVVEKRSPDARHEYYSDNKDFLDSQVVKSTVDFLHPFTYVVPNAPSNKHYQQERNLYLVIQVASYNDTGLVVLEGDYVNSWRSNNDAVPRNLTLLHFNSKANIAFSNRLLEYLLLSIPYENEALDGNIQHVQTLLTNANEKNSIDSTNSDKYKSWKILGAWEPKIKDGIRQITNKYSLHKTLRDLDGYLNKDIEKFLIER